jgi:hypothetical protein
VNQEAILVDHLSPHILNSNGPKTIRTPGQVVSHKYNDNMHDNRYSQHNHLDVELNSHKSSYLCRVSAFS